MQQKPPTPSESKTTTRSRARTTGILLVAAVVLLSFSGAAAPALQTADVAPPPLPNISEGDDKAADKSGIAAPAATLPATTPDTDRSDAAEPTRTFTTGDRLDAEARADFLAHIADMKDKGLHKGPAIYTSW